MKKEIRNKKQRIVLNISLFVIFLASVLLINLASAESYSRSVTGYSQYVGVQYSTGDTYFPFVYGADGSFNRNLCQAGQDFLLYVSPTGCIPSVVRSDLLEEQNVPVFCPIMATKLNPLINVDAIDYVSFRGNTPKEVSGIGYYPAQAALGKAGFQVTSSLANNIGYAVIVLKQQKNESAMPSFVEGNITAVIKYDIKNAFGVGQASFYLPVMSDAEWNENFKRYGFWQGRGYLRVDSVEDDRATISIYSDRETYSLAKTDKKVVATVPIEIGKTSREILMPGFDYCMGGLQLKLNGIENPDTMVKLNVNGDYFDLKKGEKFIDEKCYVKNLDKRGVIESVEITCREDVKTNTFSLSINPKIVLEMGGVARNYSLGEKLYAEIKDGKETGKSVYLVYARTKGDTRKEENLTVTLAAIPGNAEKLSDSDLTSIGKFLNKYPSPEKSSTIAERGINALKSVLSGTGLILRGIIEGQAFKDINVNEPAKELFGKNIKLIGFAGARDADTSRFYPLFKEYYDNAMKDYNAIIGNYPSEKYPQEEQITLGQRALTEMIGLAYKAQQMRTIMDLCRNFEEKYSNFDVPDVCQDSHKLSSFDASSKDVEIGGKVYSISMVRIQEPSFEDLGVTIDISGTSVNFTGSRDLRLNDRVYVNESEYISLIGLEKDYAVFDISGISRAATTVGSTVKINLNSYELVGSNNYRIGVTTINLKKVAKVSVIPRIERETTNATFSFKIGIEKRGIQLTPEKTQERIEKLNKTIAQWKNLNEKLGSVVKAGKAACLVTGTALTIKNFFANLKGEGIAREMVMRKSGGWFEFCEVEKIKTGQSVDSCLLANSDKIDSNVEEVTKIIQEQNNKYKELQEGITKRTDFLGEDVVDTDALMKRFVDEDPQFKNDLNNIVNKLEKVKISGSDVNVSEIIKGINSETITLTQAREIQLNSKLLNSEDAKIKEIAKKNLEASLGDVWVNSRDKIAVNTLKDKLPDGLKDLGVSVRAQGTAITEVYEGKTTTQQVGQIPANVPAQTLIYGGKDYIIELEKAGETYRVKEIYDTMGNKIDSTLSAYQEIKNKFIFRQFDKTTYKNPSTTMVLRYYETGNYKGVPAIVPFDTSNGWYAAIKPSIPILGAIKPVDDSGRVSSFWLCNVGSNKKEEFFELTDSGRGDDICQMINRATGQTYDSFPGLDSSEASKLVNNAQLAISQAQRAYKSGMSNKVNILGKSISLGEPTFGNPDIQCQDFMSPKDCNLMFNVCDPVVCPSSRCNLGGAYTVKDVIQSGIAGSIALCLPNFPEVIVPVCLSGVHAGIDGYLSVMESYQECLETSLKTGQTVGICDYLNSVYMCEFFWKQSLPAVKYVVPKLISKIVGQDVRGGGEYLSAKDAWEKAGDSVDFFTQYYAANSYAAFKARSLEGVGTEFCKNWLSIPGLGNGELFDALIAPDSPSQFYGSFEEIPFTTATVPPISQYKVFYHIYAGKDLPAYYEVYLKGDVGYYYQDVSSRRLVARGFIATGESASNTEDFTAPSGYNELCIVVNNQEECGFKQVSTDFAVQYISDSFVAQQAKQTDVTSSTECVSGTSSLLSLLNPNLQAGATELLNPAIYNRGIIRICSTDNPGKTTDSYAGTEKARWKEVGYCDTTAIKCWLDTKSVKDTIEIGTIENATLSEVSTNYLSILMNGSDYVENFDELVKEIENENVLTEKIKKVNENLDKVYFNYQKGYLTLLRGDASKALANLAISLKVSIAGTETTSDKTETPPSDKTETVSDYRTPIDNIGITSPILEYESGGTLGLGKNKVYYIYSKSKWYFSLTGEQKTEEWFPIDKTLPEYGKLSTKNQELTNSLVDKSYLDGLMLLIYKTTQNEDGGFLSNVYLSTKRIEFSHNKRFTFQSYEPLTFYFEYDDSLKKWKWSDNKEQWFSVSENISSASDTAQLALAYETENLRPLIEKFKNLVGALREKSFYQGSALIFQIDAVEFSIETPSEAETCPVPSPTEAVLAISDPQKRVLKTVEELNGKPAPGSSCFHSIEFVYRSAAVDFGCTYSDKSGQQYNIDGEIIIIGEDKDAQNAIIFLVPTGASSCKYPLGALNYQQKLDQIQPGDWLDVAWTDKSSHAVIFIGWENKEKGYARIFDWIGGGSRTYGYQNVYLTENTNPVYLHRSPVLA